MKKKLSFLLAMVMILSLLPVMSVSASSTNGIDRVPSVADDQNWGTSANATEAPRLRIELKSDITIPASGIRTFALTISNAEWQLDDSTESLSFGSGAFVHTAGSPDATIPALTPTSTLNDSGYNISISQISLSRVDVSFNGTLYDVVPKDSVIYIPILAKLKGSGESTVAVSGSDIGISDGTYTFAYGGSGATTSSISSTSAFADTLNLKEIVIDETRPGSITGSSRLKLTATAGFEWVINPSVDSNGDNLKVKVAFSRGLSHNSPINEYIGDNLIKYGSYGSSSTNTDKEVIYIDLTTDGNSGYTKSESTAGTIVISNLTLVATDDARYGDVNVSLSGAGLTGQTLKVGEYVKYGISLTAEDKDLPVIVAGDYPYSWDTDRIKTLKVEFAEETIQSWFATRKTTFTLNDGVKMRAVKITKGEKLSGTNNTSVDVSIMYNTNNDTDESVNNTGSVTFANGTAEIAIDDATKLTTRSISKSTTEKAKFTMQFFVSVEPGYTGDITLTVGGDGVSEEATAVIAKAISPFTVETSSTDLNLGYKNIPVADILIKENVKEGIRRSGENTFDPDMSTDLLVYVEGMSIDRDSSTVEVIEGDMTLDKVEARTSTGSLHVTIKRESTTPSTLKISGTTITLDRTLAQGDYELRISGIVCANYSDNSKLKYATFSTEYYIGKSDYVRVVTPAQVGPTTTKVSVSIGSTTLNYGENTTTMDVEPFIEGGYTMVPARWIAIALGLNESDISWNANNKTVTIYANNRVAMLTAGSNKIIVNGVEDTFDGPSVMIRNNRTFIPFRALGEKVMGVGVSWDEPTRTATFNADV